MAWYRKHRPRKISDLHLTNVRDSLSQMMKQGKFPQVMLFAGPKGTGKTSSSRIIGNLLNDESNADLVDAIYFKKGKAKSKSFVEPKTDHQFAEQIYAGTSFVVQEMDAASHRGIDDVRALKERVSLPPQQGKMAVYILDEAHMLTTEAFNALLKLLEEPPSHAVFILATTELHKIPETIVSRSTKLDFRKATEEEIKKALEVVLKEEKIKFDDDALSLVAKRADGSFRDAVKSVELAAKDGKLTKESAELALGGSIDGKLIELVDAVLAKDEQSVSSLIKTLREQNLAEGFFYKNLFNFLHKSLMQGLGVEDGEPAVNQKVAKFLLDELLKANLDQYTPIAFLPLELSLLGLIQRSKDKGGSKSGGSNSNPKAQKAKSAKKKINQVDLAQSEMDAALDAEFGVASSTSAENVEVSVEPEPEPETIVDSSPVVKEAVVEQTTTVRTDGIIDEIPENIEELGKKLIDGWEDFVENVYSENAALAALLRSGQLSINSEGLPELGVYYKFHLEQLELLKNIKILQDLTNNAFGNVIPVRVVLKDAPKKAKLVEPKEKNKLPQTKILD